MTFKKPTVARNTRLSFIKNNAVTIALSIGIGIMISACGGNTSPPPPPPPPPPVAVGDSFNISGSGQKGLILGGAIEVFDAADLTKLLVTGTSNASTGQFDVTIPPSINFEGPFVKVVVKGGSGAKMICDAANGCGTGISFGDQFDIDNTVSLSAIIPSPANNASETVYLSMLTTLAAELAAS